MNFVQLVITSTLKHHDTTLSGTRCQNQSILPWSPCDAIHRRVKIILENFSPAVIVLLLEDFDLVVISARRNHAFVFRMSPCDLPDWTLMNLKGHGFLLLAIFECRDLQESITVARC